MPTGVRVSSGLHLEGCRRPVALGAHTAPRSGNLTGTHPPKNELKAVTANSLCFMRRSRLWNCDCIEALVVVAPNDHESFRKSRSNRCPPLLTIMQSLPSRCSLQESMHTWRRNVVWFGMNRSTRAGNTSSSTKSAGSNNLDCGALFCGHTTR